MTTHCDDRMETRHVVGGDERRLEYRLEIDAPPDAVWRALTEGEELERWFPFQAQVEPGEGGSVWMSWDGNWQGRNRIHIWEPGKHLRTAWAEGASTTPLAVDFHIEGDGSGSVLRLVHHGFGAEEDWDEMYDGIRRGWSFELRALRHYLQHHRGVDRSVATAEVPLPRGMDMQRAWDLMVSGQGFGLELDAVGERAVIGARAGDKLSGRVMRFEPPWEAAVYVDGWNRALLRLLIERCGGPDTPVLAMAWLETWGVDRARVEALSEHWRRLLEALIQD